MRASWKDRPRPATARRLADHVPMSTPPSSIRPPSTGSTPEMRSKTVVLPAPLGPISPSVSPLAQLEA